MDFELTASMVKCFKQCPRRYELEYVYDLKPKMPAAYLDLGTDYHSRLEALLKGEEWSKDGIAGAMANAFDTYVPWRQWDIKAVESEFWLPMATGLILKGKMDAVLMDGTPVEHKTFGGGDWDKYVHHLAWDDQATLYMLAAGTNAAGMNKVIYTVCKKPTIRQRRGEWPEEYEERCWHWYDPDEGGADKVRVFEVTRAWGEIEAAHDELIALAQTIKRGHFYRNPQACALVACPYESICLSYRGEIVPVAFEKKMKRSEELCTF